MGLSSSCMNNVALNTECSKDKLRTIHPVVPESSPILTTADLPESKAKYTEVSQKKASIISLRRLFSSHKKSKSRKLRPQCDKGYGAATSVVHLDSIKPNCFQEEQQDSSGLLDLPSQYLGWEVHTVPLFL